MIWKGSTGLFFPPEVMCNTSFFSMINWFSSFLILFSLLHINVIDLGYFPKIKEIMNVNRCIIFSFEKSVMIKSMIMVIYMRIFT